MSKESKISKKIKGFSMIEMLIVMGTMIILGSIAVPNYVGYQRRATIDAEAKKMVAFLRDGVSRAKSQEEGVVWVIEIKNESKDYYQLRSGGPSGTPVGTTYLNPMVQFTSTTTDVMMSLSSGPNLQILETPTSTIQVGLTAQGGKFSDTITMDAFGRTTRISNY